MGFASLSRSLSELCGKLNATVSSGSPGLRLRVYDINKSLTDLISKFACDLIKSHIKEADPTARQMPSSIMTRGCKLLQRVII